MNECCINLSFYKPPGLPEDPCHKIDINDQEDMYNPFSNINFIYNILSSLNKKILSNIENLLYKQIVDIQLNKFYQMFYIRCFDNERELNNFLKLCLMDVFNKFLDEKHSLLHETLKDKDCPYVFCIFSTQIASIGMQLFLARFGEFFIVSDVYAMFVDIHDGETQVKLCRNVIK